MLGIRPYGEARERIIGTRGSETGFAVPEPLEGEAAHVRGTTVEMPCRLYKKSKTSD